MATTLKCGKIGLTLYLDAALLERVRKRAGRTGARVNEVLARAVARGMGR